MAKLSTAYYQSLKKGNNIQDHTIFVRSTIEGWQNLWKSRNTRSIINYGFVQFDLFEIIRHTLFPIGSCRYTSFWQLSRSPSLGMSVYVLLIGKQQKIIPMVAKKASWSSSVNIDSWGGLVWKIITFYAPRVQQEIISKPQPPNEVKVIDLNLRFFLYNWENCIIHMFDLRRIFFSTWQFLHGYLKFGISLLYRALFEKIYRV